MPVKIAIRFRQIAFHISRASQITIRERRRHMSKMILVLIFCLHASMAWAFTIATGNLPAN
jgi:hypothetical protein